MLATLLHWSRVGFLRLAVLVGILRGRFGPDGALLIVCLVPLAAFLAFAGIAFALGVDAAWAVGLAIPVPALVLLVCLVGLRQSPEALAEAVERHKALHGAWRERRAVERAEAKAECEALRAQRAEAEQEYQNAGIRHYETALAGLNYRNPNGSDRRQLARLCRRNEPLQLDPEPDNPVDSNAIAVRRRNGAQLGYLPAEQAEEVADRSERGWRYRAVFRSLLPPSERFPHPGTLIAIIAAPESVTAEQLDRYTREHFG